MNIKNLLLISFISVTALEANAGEKAYVANEVSGNVSIIDLAKGAVEKVVPEEGTFGKKIQKVIVDNQGKYLYVADAKGNAVVVYDLAANAIKARLAVGESPEGMDISPVGDELAVCLEEEHAVAFVNLNTLKIDHKIKTSGRNPEHCLYSPDKKFLFASNEETNDVDVIDLTNKKSIALIKTGGHPRGMGFLKDGKTLYVAKETANQVDVIDASTKKIISTIPVGARSNGVAISPDSTKVYISNGGDGTVSVIETTSNKVVATISVGKRPWNMALSQDGSQLYVANGRSNDVSVIDTVKNFVIKTIPVGKLPWGVYIK